MTENESIKIINDYKQALIFISTYFIFRVINRKKKVSNKKLLFDRELSINNVEIKPSPNVSCEQYMRLNYSFKYRKEITEFLSTIKTSVCDINLNLFLHNINTLKIIKRNNFKNVFKSTKILGLYNVKKNNIIYAKYDSSTIFHELLHLSSSINIGKYTYSGFHQYQIGNDFFTIGRVINEGYTSLLEQRLFNSNVEHSYIFEINIASILETIIGEEKMEQYYFTANLNQLIMDLEEYDTEENILKFLKNVDFISNHFNKHVTNDETIYLQNAYDNISNSLLKWSTKSLINKYSNHYIGSKEISDKLEKAESEILGGSFSNGKVTISSSNIKESFEMVMNIINEEYDKNNKTIKI